MEIEVKGHSGCRIDVISEDGQIYVYKSTTDPKYLLRLALQAKKQMIASNIEYQHIRVPKILELTEKEDITIIKMQYVYSKNFIEFFEQAGFEQVEYFIEALIYFVEYEINKCSLQTIAPAIFQDKFADIRKKVESNPIYARNVDVSCLMERCQDIFDNIKDMVIPVGICHGDLTFSNILFNGNNYYFIDFLDSFIESPLLDIVKIRQDTYYRWSQLMYTKPFDAVRLRIICDKIDSEISIYFGRKYDWYCNNYRVLQLMNILRILPYANDERIICYLVKIIYALIHETI